MAKKPKNTDAEQWEDLGLSAWIKNQQAEIYGGRKVLPDSHVEDDDDGSKSE